MTDVASKHRVLLSCGLVIAATATLVLPAGPTGENASAAPRTSSSIGSDFDGDGFSDLALNARPETDAGVDTVVVLYGSKTGLRPSRRQNFEATDFGRVLTRDDPERPVGRVLATGNFDGDRYADLVLGEPYARVNKRDSAGAVRIVYGSRHGLDLHRMQLWTQRTRGVPGKAEGNDSFGDSLTVGNFGHGKEDDLAIGASGESNRLQEPGAVNIIYGSPTGLAASDSQIFSGTTAGVPGISEDFEMFGTALAAGRFSNSGYDDLAISVPSRPVAGEEVAGAVIVLRGSRRGLTVCGSQHWTQDTPGIAGKSQDGDRFGESLTVGQFGQGRYDDLAIGVPGESHGPRNDEGGAVNVLYGSAAGLTSTGNQIWSQRSRGVAGAPESQDAFGMTLVAANFGNDRDKALDDLAIAVDESISGVYRAGQVHILFGQTSGLTAEGTRVLTTGTSGALTPQMNDEFGAVLAVGDFGIPTSGRRYADLAAQSSDDDPALDAPRSGVHILYGSAAGPGAQSAANWTLAMLGVRPTHTVWTMASN